MTEYRLMLADKLVNNLAYDTDKEVQNLELLKLRFGESSMHHCEIMVRLGGRTWRWMALAVVASICRTLLVVLLPGWCGC